MPSVISTSIASVRALSLGRRFTARAATRAARSVEYDAVVYLSSFENHPRAVSALAVRRVLWGNAPEVLRRVRNPMLVAQALRARGCTVPEVRLTLDLPIPYLSPDPSVVSGSSQISMQPRREVRLKPNTAWLVKPLASGGGHRVQAWPGAASLPRGCYLQEWVDGTPGSVVFVASGGRAVPIGVSRQLIGDRAFGAAGYRVLREHPYGGRRHGRCGARGPSGRACPRSGGGIRRGRPQRHRLRRP